MKNLRFKFELNLALYRKALEIYKSGDVESLESLEMLKIAWFEQENRQTLCYIPERSGRRKRIIDKEQRSSPSYSRERFQSR